MKQLALILKAGSVLALALVAIGHSLEKSAERHSTRAPASLIAPSPGTEARSLFFKPEAKQRYTYSFQRKIDLHGLGTEIPSIAYSGKFMIDVLSADANGFTAIAHSKVNEYSGKEPPLLRVKLDASGKKIEIKAAVTSDEELQQYAAVTKDLISLWDFPSDTDTLGKYESRTESYPTKPNFQVQKKTKLKYLSQNQTSITSSTHWLRWDETLAFPTEVKGDESTRLGQTGAFLDSFTSYHLTFESRSAIPDYSAAQLAKLSQNETIVLAQGRASDHPEYNKVNWTALVEKLKRLDKLTSSERLAAFGDLAKVLRREPSSLEKVLALLSPADIRAGVDSTLFKTIVGALASSGSPADQNALLGIYQNPDCPFSGKGAILSALTTTQATPTSDTTDFLRNEMEQENVLALKQGASYALGSGLATAMGESADSALNSLRTQWRNALQSGNIDAQLALLDAIGNSGRAEFFPDVNAVAQSQSAVTLRAKAIFSMRFMNTSASQSAIISQFDSSNETMRESAVAAVGLAPWAEQFRSPLQNCTSHESIDRIQKECSELLTSHGQMAGN